MPLFNSYDGFDVRYSVWWVLYHIGSLMSSELLTTDFADFRRLTQIQDRNVKGILPRRRKGAKKGLTTKFHEYLWHREHEGRW
jgi:hypothetical protein